MTLGRRLKVACTILGVSLEQAAERSGVSASTVWGLASGRRQPSITLLRAVCAAINVRVCWLLEGEGDIWCLPKAGEVPETTASAALKGTRKRKP